MKLIERMAGVCTAAIKKQKEPILQVHMVPTVFLLNLDERSTNPCCNETHKNTEWESVSKLLTGSVYGNKSHRNYSVKTGNQKLC